MKKFIVFIVIFMPIIIAILILKCFEVNKEFADGVDNIINFMIIVFNNSYVINIITSVFVVIIMYAVHIVYCKKKIKKDTRCSEVIMDIIYTIRDYYDLQKAFPTEIDCWEEGEVRLYEFYKSNNESMELLNGGLLYHNNEIIMKSLRTCFFVNINFNLLEILNNLDNRTPNLIKGYPKIEELYRTYEKNKCEENLKNLNWVMWHYLMDLRFMIEYWEKLFAYLNIDHEKAVGLINKLTEINEEEGFYAFNLENIDKKRKKIIKKLIKTLG